MLTNHSFRKMNTLYPDFYYTPESEQERDKRLFRRFHCKKKVSVFFGSDYGRVDDISLGGLSFLSMIMKGKSPDREIDEREAASLDLLFGMEEILASDLPSRLVYTNTIPISIGNMPQCCHRNRYGLSFQRLSARQMFMVKCIILKGTYI